MKLLHYSYSTNGVSYASPLDLHLPTAAGVHLWKRRFYRRHSDLVAGRKSAERRIALVVGRSIVVEWRCSIIFRLEPGTECIVGHQSVN